MSDELRSQNCILIPEIRCGRRIKLEPLFPNKKETQRGASRFIDFDAKYIGQYIAMPSFNDRTVLAYGTDRVTVRNIALKKGCSKPVIVFVD